MFEIKAALAANGVQLSHEAIRNLIARPGASAMKRAGAAFLLALMVVSGAARAAEETDHPSCSIGYRGRHPVHFKRCRLTTDAGPGYWLYELTTPSARRFRIENGATHYTAHGPDPLPPQLQQLVDIQVFGDRKPTPRQQRMLDSWWLDGRRADRMGPCFTNNRVSVCAAAW